MYVCVCVCVCVSNCVGTRNLKSKRPWSEFGCSSNTHQEKTSRLVSLEEFFGYYQQKFSAIFTLTIIYF